MELRKYDAGKPLNLFLYENEDIEGSLIDDNGNMLDFDFDGFPIPPVDEDYAVDVEN